MSPAFSSPKQAATFAFLLLVILLLPALFGESGLPPREQIYLSVPSRFGFFPYLRRQIFVEKEDIDIAFVGSSRVFAGIDTPYVQEKLSEQLGRKAVVRTVAWVWEGFDALYFITQDLLKNRKVHMLVISDEYVRVAEAPHNPVLIWLRRHLRLDRIQLLQGGPHPLASRWFRFGDNAEALAGLQLPAKASYYASAVLGMPRNLLSLLRPAIPEDLNPGKEEYWEAFSHGPDPATRLGSLKARLAFPDYDPDRFVDYTPPGGALSSDVYTYSAATKPMFQFPGPPTPPLQLYFARKVAALAREQGVKLVWLHMPTVAEIRAPAVPEREFWPDALGADVTMVGIPPAKMFAGMSDEDVLKLFYEALHLNQNGQEYFTPLITPSLLRIYDAQAKR